MKVNRLTWCPVLLFASTVCVAQMYTVTDLGTLGGTQSDALGINKFGQVVGLAFTSGDAAVHPFRTAPNSPINPTTDDLGTFGDYDLTLASGINASGQVVGNTWGSFNHAFRTAPNGPLNPAADDLGTLGGPVTWANGINDCGQVVGQSWITFDLIQHAYRTAPHKPINAATDDLGTLCEPASWAFDWGYAINASGQVAGESCGHAFRTAPNSRINRATDDLGMPGLNSAATAINDFGQVVGWTNRIDYSTHAFRTAPNKPINLATDDLGTLGGTYSEATGIDGFGQVVGVASSTVTAHPFLYSGGTMHDLIDLIQLSFGCELANVVAINNSGQIAGSADCTGGICNGVCKWHAVRLDPIYAAIVEQPINADGSSVFSAKRGVIPVKFTLDQYGAPTCTLLPATIAITRASGGALTQINESNPHFRTDGCRYHYNLAAAGLGVGTYRVDISINGIMIGHAAFTLR